ncbi:TPA: polysaccharide biosynthesis protein [Streptococcus suis]
MSRSLKVLILIAVDLIMMAVSMYASMQFLDILFSMPWSTFWLSYAPIGVVYVFFSRKQRLFSRVTRFTDQDTLLRLTFSLVLAYVIGFLYSALVLHFVSFRFSLISLVFSIVLLTFPRLTWRSYYQIHNRKVGASNQYISTLVVGAGEGAHLFIKTIGEEKLPYRIVGIVDDDVKKRGTHIGGVGVLGTSRDILDIILQQDVKQVVIAIPSLSGKERERIVEICQQAHVPVFNMPNIEDVLSGKLSVSALREIDIADLLGRPEVVLQQERLSEYFSQKTVLVTGAGGSIGSEICRQVARFSPKQLLLLGHGENSIYLIHRELQASYKGVIDIVPIIADIQDRERLFQILADYRPNIVYHAAAHKHVPLMEYNPHEAVKNNIFGTKNIAEAAKANQVEKFVMVSTDKAVNPPNVMGATKRVAEMIVTNLNEKDSTQFVAVRFGNVLGSRGSVVPLFKEQIKNGGPVTVTDFRMTRYFMTIPEASRLVIQSGYLAKGGEVFVLDMGEPVKILDLARKVIKLSGHTEEEIGIVESGIRPGEKLYEELLSTDERVSEQIYDKIFVGRVQNYDKETVEQFIQSLAEKSTEALKKTLIDFAKQE